MHSALRVGHRLALLTLSASAAMVMLACEGEPARPAASTPVLTPPAQGQTAPGPSSLAPSPEPSPTARPPLVRGAVALEPALGGREFDSPTELVPYVDGTYLVADRDGLVLRVSAAGEVLGTFLDQRNVTLTAGAEEGLLSVALDPDFERNRFVYVYASRGEPRRTVLHRYTVTSDHRADPASELLILEVGQPFANHNGGALRFGPDGLLYLGLGDGGSRGDPNDRAQNLADILGKIVRLDVRGASRTQPYRPAGDPGLGARGARPEVWAYGFRNPWRMAFDRATGVLYAGDVGQNRWEEVDRVLAGGNYGWSILEGFECFKPSANCPRDGTIPPMAAYRLSEGNCAVTGGEVYRGSAIPALYGHYLYADYCSGRLWAIDVESPGGEPQGEPVLLLDSDFQIPSMATGHDGEVYLLAFGAPVQKLVPASR